MRRRQREGGRKCQGRVGLKTAGEFPVSHVGEGRTYIFDGVLVNFGFCLPQMMPIYWQKNKVQRLVWLIMSCILIYKQDGPLMGGGYNLQILVPVKRQRCLICGVGVSASCLVPCWNYCCLHALKLYSVAFFFFFLHVYSVILETDCQVVKYNDAGSDRATNKKHQFSPLAQCSVTHKTARPSASSANSTVYSASKVFSLLFHPQVEIFNFLKFALHVYKVNSLPYSVFSISII